MKHTVYEHNLPSGAKGLVIDVPGSNVVSLAVRFNSGYQFGDRRVYEVPHVLEHTMSTVTHKHPAPNEFYIEAQKNGAFVNAYTSPDSNAYVYECADFEFERIVGLLGEQLTAPLFAEQPVRAEVGNVTEELTRNLTQHSSVCAVALGEKCFPHLWMGYEERIKQLPNITVEQLRGHYVKTHTSGNARFYAAGSFADGGRNFADQMSQILAQVPQGPRLVRSRAIGLDVAVPILTKREIEQLYYRIVLCFGELTEPQRRAITLLRMVLVGGMGSRILGEARRRGLAYGVGGSGHAEPGNSSFGFTGFVTEHHADELFQLMVREYSQIREQGPTLKELDAAKDLVVGSVQRSTQTVADILGWYLDPYDEDDKIRDFDETMQLIRDVQPEEVMEVARMATAGGRKGMSFLGPITQAVADRYAAELAPLWVSK